jgi:hypothetical protein
MCSLIDTSAKGQRAVLHPLANTHAPIFILTCSPIPLSTTASAPRHCPCRIQSLFNALGDEVVGKTIGLGGDGRYFNKEAVQIILRIAAGNGVAKVIVGQDAIMATPAMSAVIRRRGLYGESCVHVWVSVLGEGGRR